MSNQQMKKQSMESCDDEFIVEEPMESSSDPDTNGKATQSTA